MRNGCHNGPFWYFPPTTPDSSAIQTYQHLSLQRMHRIQYIFEIISLLKQLVQPGWSCLRRTDLPLHIHFNVRIYSLFAIMEISKHQFFDTISNMAHSEGHAHLAPFDFFVELLFYAFPIMATSNTYTAVEGSPLGSY